MITAECPLPCLKGIIRQPALNALRYELRDDDRPHGTIGWLAEWHQAGKLKDIRNLGIKSITEIDLALKQAGIIPRAARDTRP